MKSELSPALRVWGGKLDWLLRAASWELRASPGWVSKKAGPLGVELGSVGVQLLKATSALFARFPCAAFQICQLWHKQIPLRLPSLHRKLFSCKDQSTRTNPTYLHLMKIWVILLVLFQHIICYIFNFRVLCSESVVNIQCPKTWNFRHDIFHKWPYIQGDF